MVQHIVPAEVLSLLYISHAAAAPEVASVWLVARVVVAPEVPTVVPTWLAALVQLDKHSPGPEYYFLGPGCRDFQPKVLEHYSCRHRGWLLEGPYHLAPPDHCSQSHGSLAHCHPPLVAMGEDTGLSSAGLFRPHAF